jgi:hypothetical protein
MLRSEVITGIQALRYTLEKLDIKDIDYYENVLEECRNAILKNEMADPHSPMYK